MSVRSNQPFFFSGEIKLWRITDKAGNVGKNLDHCEVLDWYRGGVGVEVVGWTCFCFPHKDNRTGLKADLPLLSFLCEVCNHQLITLLCTVVSTPDQYMTRPPSSRPVTVSNRSQCDVYLGLLFHTLLQLILIFKGEDQCLHDQETSIRIQRYY